MLKPACCCAVLCAGRLADMASQMGVSGASGTLADLSKGVSSVVSMLTAEVSTAARQHVAAAAFVRQRRRQRR
jgi:hypothetical protein